MLPDGDELRAVPHLGDVMRQRDISADMVMATISAPDAIVAANRNRVEYRRLYYDEILRQQMVLRVIVEPGSPPTVITAMKSSKIRRYLRENDA